MAICLDGVNSPDDVEIDDKVDAIIWLRNTTELRVAQHKSRNKVAFSQSLETRSLKHYSYLVVVGVETLDDVDAEEDVDTELEVDALKIMISIKYSCFNGFILMALAIKEERKQRLTRCY